MSKINYDLNFLDLVKNLSRISESIIFNKKNDKIYIRRKSKNSSMVFLLSTDESKFDFEGDDITIEKFSEFYEMISVLDSPEIELKENKLVLKKNNTKINYVLSSRESVLKDINEINFGTSDISLNITKDEIKNIIKYIALVKGEYINVKVDKDILTLRMFNQTHDNSIDRILNIENESKCSFEYIITSDFFTNIPMGDYVLNFKKDGFVKLDYVSNDFKLEIITTEMED